MLFDGCKNIAESGSGLFCRAIGNRPDRRALAIEIASPMVIDQKTRRYLIGGGIPFSCSGAAIFSADIWLGRATATRMRGHEKTRDASVAPRRCASGCPTADCCMSACFRQCGRRSSTALLRSAYEMVSLIDCRAWKSTVWIVGLIRLCASGATEFGVTLFEVSSDDTAVRSHHTRRPRITCARTTFAIGSNTNH